MNKKVIGIILLVLGIGALILGLVQGDLFVAEGGPGYAAGKITGQIIGFGLLIVGGIYLIVKGSKK